MRWNQFQPNIKGFSLLLLVNEMSALLGVVTLIKSVVNTCQRKNHKPINSTHQHIVLFRPQHF